MPHERMSQPLYEPPTEFHLQLNEQAFRIPFELLQRNQEQLDRTIETETAFLERKLKDIDSLLTSNTTQDDKAALAKLNALIKHVDALERQLDTKVQTERDLLGRIEARIQFFNELDSIKTSKGGSNVRERLIAWYQKYTDILIADYLTRNLSISHQDFLDLNERIREEDINLDRDDTPLTLNSGVQFIKRQHLENLLDYDILLTANEVSRSLLEAHDLKPLLAWIKENKKFLKKKGSQLEFKARFQEYIELLKQADYSKAIVHLQERLLPLVSTHFREVRAACGLLVFINQSLEQARIVRNGLGFPYDIYAYTSQPKDTEVTEKVRRSILFEQLFRKRIPIGDEEIDIRNVTRDSLSHIFMSDNLKPYTSLLDDSCWSTLNECFLREYYSLYGISTRDPLLIYMSLGISTLKTRECLHPENTIPDKYSLVGNYAQSHETRDPCPVCSDTIAPLAESLPFAHHTESKLFDNPVMLPSGNVYDSERLKKLAGILRMGDLVPLGPTEVFDPIEQEIYKESDFIKMYPT